MPYPRCLANPLTPETISARICAIFARQPTYGQPHSSRLKRFRFGNDIPLGEVHTDFFQLFQTGIIFNPFRNRLIAQGVSNIVDGLNDGEISGVVSKSNYKTAIDLQVIHGQCLQIAERRQTATEIIQRKAAAQCFQFLDKLNSL